jgi:hypothetical protein
LGVGGVLGVDFFWLGFAQSTQRRKGAVEELRNKKQKIRNKEVERIDFRNSQPIELIERFEPLEPFFCFAQSTQGSKGAK